ncbi:unnamed protein product [Tetraodon nigroviridis]|uniref:UTP--glucose-1-phosphate uridylyltransferase n=1 Tax=Tetraodon nigroviridis TaxID=99883 RepID=Q4TBA7_TETNG|nr:unnamed protein product [Tetraodon nigroviridis]
MYLSIAGLTGGGAMTEFQEKLRQQHEESLHRELEALLATAEHGELQSSRKDFRGFQELFHRFLQVKGPSVDWSKIRRPPEPSVQPYEQIKAKGLPDDVSACLSKLAVVKLNGGLGTSMGCKGPKSLISVRNENTFLDLTVQQIEHLNKRFNTDVPLVLMNSFNTDHDTKKILQKYKHHRVNIHTFNQSRYPRINRESLLPIARSLAVGGENAEAWYPLGTRRHLRQLLQLRPAGPADRGGEGVRLRVQHRQPGRHRRPLHPAPPDEPAGRQTLRVHHGGHGQDQSRRQGRHPDPVRGPPEAAGDRSGPEGPRGRVQVRQQVQDLQHQQPVDLAARHQEAAGPRRPGHGDHHAGRRLERHPAGDGGGRRHQELQQRHGRERAAQPLPAREDVLRPAAGDVQPVQPGRRLAHHEREEGVPQHAARQAGQLLHQGPGVSVQVRQHPGHAGAGPPDRVWRRHLREERLSEGDRHHHRQPRRPHRHPGRSHAGEQDRLREPAHPRPLRPSGRLRPSPARAHVTEPPIKDAHRGSGEGHVII